MTNPYLQQQADALTAASNQNLTQNVLPGISRGAVATGGYGGSREAIAQGIATGNAQTGLDQTIAGMYSQAYESDANRALQQQMQQQALQQQMQMAQMQDATSRYGLGLQNDWNLGSQALQRLGIDNQYSLGMGGLDLQRLGLNNQFNLGQRGLDLQQQGQANQYDLGMQNIGLGYYGAGNQYALGQQANQNAAQANQNNFYTQQRGQDLQSLGIGANLWNMGMQGMGQQGQGMYNAGQMGMQGSFMPYQMFGNLFGPFTGTNQTTYGPGQSQWGGLLGGFLGGAQLGGLFGG